MIEAEDDDDIVVKLIGDRTILTNLEPKLRVRDVRQAEDLLGKSKISGMSSMEPVQKRAMKTES